MRILHLHEIKKIKTFMDATFLTPLSYKRPGRLFED